jgi:hypothetical protein
VTAANGAVGTERVASVSMLRALRILLLLALTFTALGLVVAASRPETGLAEKAVLVAAVFGVLSAGAPVRRLGADA